MQKSKYNKPYSEEELEIQMSTVKRNIWLVFIPVFLLIFALGYYQSNSLDHLKNEYMEALDREFSGKVISKRQEGDYTRAGRFIFLDSNYEDQVENDTYDRIKIGDTVFKKKNSDHSYYILQSGDTIIEYYTYYFRKRYEDLKNEKKN